MRGVVVVSSKFAEFFLHRPERHKHDYRGEQKYFIGKINQGRNKCEGSQEDESDNFRYTYYIVFFCVV